MNTIPDLLILDETDVVDLHPFADWAPEQLAQVEQEVMSNQQLLERRQQEQAQSLWW